MVVFGLWILVLFGFAAFAVDVSRIYTERAELQNGADAAALAIAMDCGLGVCDGGYDSMSNAEVYADSNALDGAALVDAVTIDTVDQTVRVEVATEEASGDTHFDMVLAQIIGYDGLTVRTDATARWGAPSGFQTLPVAFSKCEWDDFGAPGFVDEHPLGFLHHPEAVLDRDLPPTAGYMYEGRAVTIYLHGTSVCGGSPSGQDLPGGFGWLDPDGGCLVFTELGDWEEIDPGASPPSACNASELRSILGTVKLIPYFNDILGTGTNADYHIHGFGALYVTGYNFGGSFKENSIIDGAPVCSGSLRCIQGYMIGDWVDSSGSAGTGGADYGTITIELIG